MKITYARILILLFCLPLFTTGQTCAPLTFKTLFYENDSNLYPMHTLNKVALTTDNAYFVGGTQIMKTDLYGNRVWDTTTFNSFYQQDAIPYLAPDGGYYLLFSNYKLTKLDAAENIIWEKNLMDTSCYCNQARHIFQTSDGGFMITGSSNIIDTAYYRNRVLIVKTNAAGDTLWTKMLAKTPMDDHGYYTQETSDGGFLVLGDYQTDATEFRVGISKLNNLGQEQWFKFLPHHLSSRTEIYATATLDNGIAFTSLVDSTSIATLLIKVNDNGDEQYSRIFSGPNNGAMTQMADGNLLIGMNDSLFRINGNTAATIWGKGYIGNYGEKLMINSVMASCDDGYIMTANAAVFLSTTICCGSDFSYYDYSSYLLKVDSTFADPSLATGIQTIETDPFSVFPNPFNSQATLLLHKPVRAATYSLTDVLGNEVKRTEFNGDRLNIEKGDLSPGIYFITIQSSELNGSVSQKIIIH